MWNGTKYSCSDKSGYNIWGGRSLLRGRQGQLKKERGWRASIDGVRELVGQKCKSAGWTETSALRICHRDAFCQLCHCHHHHHPPINRPPPSTVIIWQYPQLKFKMPKEEKHEPGLLVNQVLDTFCAQYMSASHLNGCKIFKACEWRSQLHNRSHSPEIQLAWLQCNVQLDLHSEFDQLHFLSCCYLAFLCSWSCF